MNTRDLNGAKIVLIVLILIVGGVIGYFVFSSGGDSVLSDNPSGDARVLTCEKDGFCVFSGEDKITKCIESDDGIDLYKKGRIWLYDDEGEYYVIKDLETVTKVFGSQFNVYEDVCVSETELWEFVCDPRDIEDKYDCPNSCVDGACVS